MTARRILLIQGHPDALVPHLCHALADAYAAGAHEAGHEVRTINVAELDFPLLRSQYAWEEGAAAGGPAPGPGGHPLGRAPGAVLSAVAGRHAGPAQGLPGAGRPARFRLRARRQRQPVRPQEPEGPLGPRGRHHGHAGHWSTAGTSAPTASSRWSATSWASSASRRCTKPWWARWAISSPRMGKRGWTSCAGSDKRASDGTRQPAGSEAAKGAASRAFRLKLRGCAFKRDGRRSFRDPRARCGQEALADQSDQRVLHTPGPFLVDEDVKRRLVAVLRRAPGSSE